MKIGIYGGTFNPPHLGHLAAARTAVDVLSLDKLLIVPDAIPPHKELPEGTPAPRCRLAMAEKLADALLLPGQAEASPMALPLFGCHEGVGRRHNPHRRSLRAATATG